MRRAAPLLGLAALLAAPAAPLAAQTVNCPGATTQLELNDCAAQAYARADTALNQAYGEAMAYARQSGTVDILRKAQRSWLPFRDAACEAEASTFAGGSIQGMVRTLCLERLTRARTQDLKIFAGTGQ